MSEAPSTYFSGNQPMQSLAPAVKALLSSPRSFFEHMPRAAYRWDAIFFVSIVVFIASFLSVPFFSMTFLFMLPVTWGLSLIALWLWSKYLSWAVRSFAKQKLSSTNAFQFSAYATFPMALSSIPYLGLITSLWSLYLLWLALVARCKVSGGASAAILLLPIVLLAASTTALTLLVMRSMS